MQRIATGYVDAQHPKAIDADLYRRYSETLRKAVELVGVDETLQDRWMANVSRFAAYKAADATRRIAEAVMENGALDDGLNPLHAHRRYLAAEANTARTRARTGKQWQQFNDADRRRLFPNLRWVPSRSAMPREAHQLFWDKVWAKDDPFWQRNQPGTLWNCKCDWEETDDPVSTDEEKKLPNGRSVDDYTIKVRGLDGNPAETGQIFSDTPEKRLHPDPNDPDLSHPLFAKAPQGMDTIVKQTVREIFRQEHANDLIEFNTTIGKIIYDSISVKEISKGAKTDASYFYKLEIAQHLDRYIDKMTLVNPSEPIDLSHNNHKSIFFQRKKLFSHMRVYSLNLHNFNFIIKMGEYVDGSLNLYAITEP